MNHTELISQLKKLVVDNNLTKLESLINDILYDVANENQIEFEEIGETVDFLANVYALALSNNFDIDVDVESTKFGCIQIAEQITTIGTELDGVKLNSLDKVNSNLISDNSRDMEVEDYFYGEDAIEEDFQHINSLLNKKSSSTNSNLDAEFEKFFNTNSFIKTLFTRTITDTLAVYERAFGSGFELTQNYGVISSGSNGVLRISKGNKIVNIKSVAFSRLSSLMTKQSSSKPNIKNRQFDPKEIAFSDVPISYPRKILEYALGRITTENCQHDEYKEFDGGKGWQPYAEGYISGNLTHFLKESIKVFLVETYGEDKAIEIITDNELIIDESDRLEKVADRCYNSFTSICLISELEGTSEDWASIEIKTTTSFFKNGRHPQSQVLIQSIIDKVKGGQGNISGTDYRIATELVEPLSKNNVITYKHIFDPVLANKRPLFAAQALDSLVQRGEKLNWENVLLGKGLNGKMIKSSKGQPIYFRDQLVHMYIAGSRSGKGVGSQNVLSTAMGSGKPVFYIDNKPDIITILKSIGKIFNDDNMFLINGANYENIFDPDHDFDMNIAPLDSSWKRTLPKWWQASSYEDIGNFVYYRGVLFCLGILLLRFWAKGNDESLYDMLNGDGGVLIFFDEFTKFQRNFSSKLLNPRGGDSSMFGDKHFIGQGELREYEHAIQEMKRLLNEDEENLKATDRKKIADYENTIKDIKQEKRAYATDMFTNLERTMNTLYDKQVAGFKGTEELFSDIFVVGQDIDIKPLPDNLKGFIRNKGLGKLSGNASYTNTCMISTFLYNFSTDYFMGYNAEKPNYMNADDPSCKTHETLTSDSKSFAYIKANRETVINGSTSTINQNATVFKPYLILNNAKEPQIHKGMPQQELVLECKKPHTQYVGGVALNLGDEWWKLREALIDEEGVLRNDIGLEGYLRRIVKENKQPINLSKSGDIADLIVQQMGYQGTYLEFLCDLRPEWNFGAQDIVDAFANPEIFAKGTNRISMYKQIFFPEESMQDDADESIGFNSDYDEDENYSEELQTFYESVDDSASKDDKKDFSDITKDFDIPNTNNIKKSTSEFAEWSTDEDSEINVPLTENNNTSKFSEWSTTENNQSSTLSENQKPSNTVNVDYNINQQEEPERFDDSNSINIDPNSVLNSKQDTIQSNRGTQSQEDLTKKEEPDYNSIFDEDDNVKPTRISIFHQKSSKLFEQANQLFEKSPVKLPNSKGQTRMERYQSNREENIKDIPPIEIRQANGNDFLIDYSNLVNMVTSDILNTVGGLTNIESIIIRDKQLIVNKLRYSKKFPTELVRGLPRDRQIELSNSQYSNLFNYGVLANAPNLISFESDESYIFNTKVANDMGINTGFQGVVDLFNHMPRLYYVTIEDREFNKDSHREDIIKAQNFFSSREKRAKVADELYGYGKEQTYNNWNTTKELYRRKGFWNKFGGTAMLGVTGVSGATTGGFNLTRKATKGLKDFFSTFAKGE